MVTSDQQRAIESAKKNVIVTASAGSGKTYTMVNRVIRLIAEEGASLSSIVMLTFTEAAAQEMKTRLCDALLKAIKTAAPQKREELVRALDEMPLLNCGTIDSFCYRLTKSHFEQIGISPMHSVADESVMLPYRKKAMDVVLKELHKRDEKGYLHLLRRFGGEEADLRKSIEDLYQYARKTEEGDAFLDRTRDMLSLSPEESPAVKEYLAYVREYAERTRRDILPLYDDLERDASDMRARVSYFANTLDEFSRCRTLRDLVNCVSGMPPLPRVGKKEKERYPHSVVQSDEAVRLFLRFRKEVTFEELKLKGEIFSDYERTVTNAQSACRDILDLIELVRAYQSAYQTLKDREKLLDYDDLEHHALVLLRDYGVGKEWNCRYLLVDECQDLNPLQDSLIRLLVEKGNLFAVGDVKQSIYRFRLSDPDLFNDRIDREKERLEESDVISFRENFRSSDEVIRFVNHLFSGLMTRDFGGVDYVEEPLIGQSKGTGGVRAFFGDKKQESSEEIKEVYSVRRAVEKMHREEEFGEESEWIRDRILEMVGKPYRDTRNDEEKILRYRDIAILSAVRMCPGSREEKVIACLRKAGIPLNLGDFERKAKLPEADAVVDLLRLIESPHDDYALLSVLRSDLFGFRLEDLVEISRAEGRTFAEKAERVAEQGEMPALSDFYRYLERMRFLSSAMTLYDLVSLVIEERYRLPLLKRRDGRQIFGELLHFADSLKGIAQAESIAEFIPFYDEYYVAEPGGEVEDGNAVSVMTVHKSKGMEFPVVFLICTDRTINSTIDLYADKEYGVIKKTLAEDEKEMRDNILSVLFKRKKNRELREDRLRLLYVALTRAENYLFISGCLSDRERENFSSPENARSMAEWLIAAFGKEFSVERSYHREEVIASSSAPHRAKGEAADPEGLRKAFSYVYPHKKATETGIKFTVTAINAMDDEGYYPPTMLFPEEKKAKGTAFHSVLENIPFTLSDEKETQEYLLKMREEGLLSTEDMVGISARRVFDAVCKVRDLVGERKVLREKSFILRLPAREAGVADIEDDVEVQGKMDLVALGEKDAIIVDYKLSGLPAEVLKEKYRSQLALYALAVQRSLGVEKVEQYIFVPGRNELIRL